jgi:hypothetical protein
MDCMLLLDPFLRCKADGLLILVVEGQPAMLGQSKQLMRMPLFPVTFTLVVGPLLLPPK